MTRKTISKAYLYPACFCFVAIIGISLYALFASVSRCSDTAYIYIDDDDSIDSVFIKLDSVTAGFGRDIVRILARHTGYEDKIHTGRYAIDPGMSAFSLFRHLHSGQQSPVKLTIPSVRTKQRLAEELSKKLMLSEKEILNALNDSNICAKYEHDTCTVISMFIPNTYEVYWNIALNNFLDKMKEESDRFWKGARMQKAEALHLSPVEIITIASIVDEETANNAEKPKIAGMYYNRLNRDMPLQACPTIKFALQQFELKRIYEKLLSVDSPYNTYKNKGLPPGPIRIPSVAGIDAVLNLEHHDYLYICAKEDFSGTHNFARTYEEHMQNSAKYSKALNERGIR